MANGFPTVKLPGGGDLMIDGSPVRRVGHQLLWRGIELTRSQIDQVVMEQMRTSAGWPAVEQAATQFGISPIEAREIFSAAHAPQFAFVKPPLAGDQRQPPSRAL